MSKNAKALTVQSASLSDRGLNERRPINEDSFLADRERSIFAVADGVGGAEAGEVASQLLSKCWTKPFDIKPRAAMSKT
jgi:serine/threonine protein phosphatase PrpC